MRRWSLEVVPRESCQIHHKNVSLQSMWIDKQTHLNQKTKDNDKVIFVLFVDEGVLMSNPSGLQLKIKCSHTN